MIGHDKVCLNNLKRHMSLPSEVNSASRSAPLRARLNPEYEKIIDLDAAANMITEYGYPAFS